MSSCSFPEEKETLKTTQSYHSCYGQRGAQPGSDTLKVPQLLLPMKRSFCKNLLRFSYSRSSE